MKIAVIPARGGSKRIPRKNIKVFAGKPMIAWTIQIAQKSGLFDHIVVSTDDEEISNIATEFGAEAPFMRPEHLADDHTPTVPVIAHALRTCNGMGWNIKYACCLYPCAPFMVVEDLISAYKLMVERNSNYVYPVTEYPHPIQRSVRCSPDGKIQFFMPQYELSRTQDLEPLYHDAAQFYWGTTTAWINEMNMHSEGLGIPIPRWRVVDIDTQDDWLFASYLFNSIINRVES